MSDTPPSCFYGNLKKLEFSIVREEQKTNQAPVTSGTRVHIVRHVPSTKRWSCLTRACAGNATDCAHRRSVRDHVERGITHCFPSIYDLLREQEQFEPGLSFDLDSENANISTPRHTRPLIPSETAFAVDHDVNKNARTKKRIILPAAPTCHCGSTILDDSSSDITVSNLRIETTRCFVNYLQELWTCGKGHCVTPEECHETRDGLLWISRDTAFTEVFLFDLLLHMTLGGGTIAGQSDLRSQLMFLQTHFMSRREGPRSSQCIRKALITYAMGVVKAIPPWVFRCMNCSTQSNGNIYYDKFSFDGQQLGFNIKRDVRYDFYGKPATPWRRPVERCSESNKLAMIIRSKNLRGIVTEVLRVRRVSPDCTSVHTLCRTMFTISLRTKDDVTASVASIKLFDPLWSGHLPIGAIIADDTSFEGYSATLDSEQCAHPFSFITDVRNQSDFDRCLRVMNVFRNVLDCTRAAAVISILVDNLRNDLRAYIPLLDQQFISNYAAWAINFLQTWLSQISQSESVSTPPPSQNITELQPDIFSGIGEHVEFLNHPFRPPFAWKSAEGNELLQIFGRQMCRVRSIDGWIAPANAQITVLLFIMALFTESVTLWIRDGDLETVLAAEEVLRNAELYAGEYNTSYHCRAALQKVHRIGLLYEGIMGLLGANIASARPMFSELRMTMELIRDRYDAYSSCIREFKSSKSFMCSPREFDDMLIWTGAVGPDPALENNHQSGEVHNNPYILTQHGRSMQDLYSKMASSKSNDFMETGTWAPDFPIRRPAPSSTVLGASVGQTEISCSKDFNTHTTFSPGTFGAYCLCRHAKTVMVTFLKRPEGCRMPLNLIVERCARLPRYIIYDFACGTQKSALSLSAEISKHISFVIDPFHFPGHKTCSLAMHASNYSELRGLNLESQEQRNSKIKVMERTLRASRDVHYMHFMVLSHAYLNLKAMYLDHHDKNEEHDPLTCTPGSHSWLKWVRDNLFTNSL